MEDGAKVIDQEFIRDVRRQLFRYLGYEVYDIDTLLEQHQPQPAKRIQGNITYLRDGRRISVRISRYLGKRLRFSDDSVEWRVSERQLEELTARIQTLTDPITFQLVSGADLFQRYVDGYGTTSCMTSVPSKYNRADLYRRNPEKIQMLTAERGNQRARALVWRFDNGRTGLDRIYSNSDAMRTAIHKYRQHQGWWDVYNGYTEDNVRLGNVDINDRKRLYITGLRVNWKQTHPYFDTLGLKRIKYDVNLKEVLGAIGHSKCCGRYPNGWSNIMNHRVYTCSDRDCLHSFTEYDNKTIKYVDGIGDLCTKCQKKIVWDRCDWCKEKRPEYSIVDVGKWRCCRTCQSNLFRDCSRCGEKTEKRLLDYFKHCPTCHVKAYQSYKQPRPRRLRGARND